MCLDQSGSMDVAIPNTSILRKVPFLEAATAIGSTLFPSAGALFSETHLNFFNFADAN